MMNEVFFRYRSLQGSLSDGVSFLTDRFWRFLYVSLPVGLPMGLVMALLALLGCWGCFHLSTALCWAFGCVLSLLLLLCCACYTGLIGRLMLRAAEGGVLDGIGFRHVYDGRWLRLSLRSLLVYVLEGVVVSVLALLWWLTGYILPSDEHVFFRWLCGGVLCVAGCIVLVPASWSLQSCLLGKGGLWHDMWHGYASGWLHWARVFSLSLLTGLLSMVICVLLLSSALVASMAQMGATQSELAGDTVDLSGWFPVLTGLVLFVSMFVSTLTLWLRLVPQGLLFVGSCISTIKENDGQG